MYNIGGQRLDKVYQLPNNDFLVRILEPGLEETLRKEQRVEQLVNEEERLFENAKTDSLLARTYKAFTIHFSDDLKHHVDIYERYREVNIEHNAKL